MISYHAKSIEPVQKSPSRLSAYYLSTVKRVLEEPCDIVVGRLAIHQPSATQEQHNAWSDQINLLKAGFDVAAASCPAVLQWSLLFEYRMLRLQRRIDVVLLAEDVIFSIEFKTGAAQYAAADRRQTEDYALDLRDFHAESRRRLIVPVLCATHAPTTKAPYIADRSDQVLPLMSINGTSLIPHLIDVWHTLHDPQYEPINPEQWNRARYMPIPNIIKTAQELYGAHNVIDIHEALAERQNLMETTDHLIELILDARRNGKHRVCFVTGVPGSGKTLTGLNAVHDPRFKDSKDESSAFLSGNTPLVAVLREALAADKSRRENVRIGEARNETRAAIQNLMDFLREYLQNDTANPPHENVIVFDEAQRAWDEAYGRQKFGRAASEPNLVLSIMSRHRNWAVIIALVGGGQEINKGEGGLKLWGEALRTVNAQNPEIKWEVAASSHAITGSAVTAGGSLFELPPENVHVEQDDSLHLPVSVRSHRCEVTNEWVEAVLSGNRFEARRKANELADFRIFLTRSLDEMKEWLSESTRGHRRCGLLASSGARRLRAYGLGVNVGATDLDAVKHWFLAPRGDVRSSYSLEITANEYGCQGLELDNVGLCWGADLTWTERGNWAHRSFSGTAWQSIRSKEKQENLRNSYRVLMTRARDSLVIWVPPGDEQDSTRPKRIMDETASYLLSCGVRELDSLPVVVGGARQGK